MADWIIPALLSLLLPWFAGSACVYAFIRKTQRWNWFIVMGHGYLVGIFSTTLLMRCFDSMGFELNYWFLAALLLVLGVSLLLLQYKGGSSTTSNPTYVELPVWQMAAILLVTAAVALRYITLAQELSIRPLYAWDAWMNWSPKALVWFHSNELTNFVDPIKWLAQPQGANNYSLGNYHASLYPPTVPLIILWGMLGTGSADTTFIYLPWIIAPLCLGLALYGHLRLAGISALLASIACYMLLGLPYLNTHTALAGYADLWLATSFGLAVFCLYEWQENRSRRYALLCLFYAAMCSQLKNPGIVLCLIILAVFLRTLLNFSSRAELTVMLTLTCVISVAVTMGLSFEIPLLGHFSVSSDDISLPILGSFTFEYHPVSGTFIRALFDMTSWGLLWYLLLPFILIKIFRKQLFVVPSSVFLAILLNLIFVVFVFHFTERHWEAEQFTTLNRAILYSVPGLIFYLFLGLNNPDESSLSLFKDKSEISPVERKS